MYLKETQLFVGIEKLSLWTKWKLEKEEIQKLEKN